MTDRALYRTESYDALHLPLPRLVELSFAGGGARLSVLADAALHRACGTRIAFTGRLGGVSAAPYASLNLASHVEDAPSAVQANRRRLLECLGYGALFERLVVPEQVHGTACVVADGTAQARALAQQGADAVIAREAGVPVLLCFADCVPIVLVAPGGAFAVVHAGWRGALAGIAGLALAELAAQAGCTARACNAYIGPHIGACCYDVGPELLSEFVSAYGAACDAGGKLSLSEAVTASLLGAGAAAERIVDAGLCTACNVDRYYSHRAEAGRTGRHGAFACREEKTWD